MPFVYCKSWFRAKKIPLQRMDQETAFALHEAGLPYTVLVDSEDRLMATFVSLPVRATRSFPARINYSREDCALSIDHRT